MSTAELTTRGPIVAKFFETFLFHRKGQHAGEAFKPEPFQQEFLDEFYELTPAGKRVYRIGILGVPRGNGKTPLSAGPRALRADHAQGRAERVQHRRGERPGADPDRFRS